MFRAVLGILRACLGCFRHFQGISKGSFRHFKGMFRAVLGILRACLGCFRHFQGMFRVF